MNAISANRAISSVVYWKRMSSADPRTYTWTTDTRDVRTVGGLVAYSGVHATTPIDAVAAATGASSTATTPSIVTTVAHTRVLRLLHKNEDVPVAPAGTTQRWSTESTSGSGRNGIALGDEAVAAVGPSATRSWTSSENNEWIGVSIALKPSPIPLITAAWTPSTSAYATVQKLERWQAATMEVQQTLADTTTTTSDGPLVNGATYTYRIRAQRTNWQSANTTATLTTGC